LFQALIQSLSAAFGGGKVSAVQRLKVAAQHGGKLISSSTYTTSFVHMKTYCNFIALSNKIHWLDSYSDP